MPPAQPAIGPRLERVIMDAVHPNRRAINTITGEAMKLSDIFEAAKVTIDWAKPMLPQEIKTAEISAAFAAHRNPFIAGLLRPE